MTSARLAFFAAASLFAAGLALAQSPVPPPPPLPPPDAAAPPPPPPNYASDPELEPQVTIIRREDQVVEEVRVNGELRYVRVTPRHGRPYFLIPDANGQAFIRRDSLDIQLKVPMWVLFSF
jgi:hypothetical protein